MADTTGASWSDIPLDLAGRILRRLPAHVDRVRFGAVCPQWRTATRHGPLPPSLPLLLLSDGKVYSLPGSKPFHFPGCTGCTDACGDWLVFSGEEGYFLRHAFSNATMALPPLSHVRTRLVGRDGGPVWTQAPPTASTMMKRPPKPTITSTHRGRDEGGVLKDEDDTLHSLIREERPLHVGNETVVDVAATLAWMEMGERLHLYEEPKKCKLWFCSPNFIVATISFRECERIAVCLPGATSWWSVWMGNICTNFVDMAFHQGKLYAIDVMDTLFIIDVSVSGDPWISQIRDVIKCPWLNIRDYFIGNRKRAYLVESRGVLLVVLRKFGQRRKLRLIHDLNVLDAAEHNEFEVFEADLSQSQWFKVTTIGNNEALFLRRRCSRSVCVSHNALPGDCIFFLDNDDKDWRWHGASSSCSVYSMTDGKISTPLRSVSWKRGMAFGTWLFPQN